MKTLRQCICTLALALGAVSPAFSQPTFTEIHYWAVDTRYGSFGYRDVQQDQTGYRQRSILLGPLGSVYVIATTIAAGAAVAFVALAGLAAITARSRRIVNRSDRQPVTSTANGFEQR